MKLDQAPQALSLRGLFFMSLLQLSATLVGCDDSSQSIREALDMSPLDASLSGTQAGEAGVELSGTEAGEAGVELSGTEAGEAGVELSGTEAGEAGVEMPMLSCGEPQEGQIGAEGGLIELLEGAMSPSQLSVEPNALAIASPQASGELSTRPLNADEQPRWGLACELNVTSLGGSWRALGAGLWVYLVPDEARLARDEALTLTRPARLSLTLPLPLPEGINANHLQLFGAPLSQAQRFDELSSAPELSPLPMLNPRFELERGVVSFAVERPGLYVLAYEPERLAPRERALTHRAIMGVSMGGGGAASIAARYPERFDFVGSFGGPSDWIYLFSYSQRRLFGGFCEALGVPVGLEGCLDERLIDPLEHPSTFEQWHYSNNGGSFDRREYLKIFQDLSMTFGSPLSFNPESPYLPVGVALTELQRPREDRCAEGGRVRLEGLYDRAYNPTASHPVITFCDGEGLRVEGARSTFDPEREQTQPFELGLAVDLNDNGKRDAGEPVLRQVSEPYEDVGCDGLPNELEPGFHPTLNPDPNRDDFHPTSQPHGTERDGLFQGAGSAMGGAVGAEGVSFDAWPLSQPEREALRVGLLRHSCGEGEPGEPWLDVGLDGVVNTPQLDEGGYDLGEGDGVFTYNPNVTRALAHNPAHRLYAQMSEGRRLPRFWLDGGVRDIFNFSLTGAWLTGRLQGEVGEGGAPARVFHGFSALTGESDLVLPNSTNTQAIDQAGWHVFVRYGDPQATQAQIEAGDGEHVGSARQVLSRFNSFLWWISRQWPQRPQAPGGLGELPTPIFEEIESEGFEGRYTFSVALPPGYNLPENAEVRYPVVYFLHGYGQKHTDMLASNAAFYGMMSSGALQKMIFVYPDGACGARWVRGEGPECSDGLDNDLDGATDLEDPGCLTPTDDEDDCREGTFYTPHVTWEDGAPGGRDYEAAFLDMMRAVDERYRTLEPEVVRIASPD